MYARLRTAPTELINRQNQLVSFLVCDSDWTYQHQHRILQISDECTSDDITAYPGELFTTDRWGFAAECITACHQDRKQGTSNWLETSIRDYSI
jgi:hypothetical protein